MEIRARAMNRFFALVDRQAFVRNVVVEMLFERLVKKGQSFKWNGFRKFGFLISASFCVIFIVPFRRFLLFVAFDNL